MDKPENAHVKLCLTLIAKTDVGQGFRNMYYRYMYIDTTNEATY